MMIKMYKFNVILWLFPIPLSLYYSSVQFSGHVYAIIDGPIRSKLAVKLEINEPIGQFDRISFYLHLFLHQLTSRKDQRMLSDLHPVHHLLLVDIHVILQLLGAQIYLHPLHFAWVLVEFVNIVKLFISKGFDGVYILRDVALGSYFPYEDRVLLLQLYVISWSHR